jgi:hypothetical protein
MLLLLIPLVLIFSGWTILLLHRFNRKRGTIWLVAVIIGVLSLIGWGVIGVFRDTQFVFDLSENALAIPAQIELGMDHYARGLGIFSLAYLMFVINAWMVKLEETHLFMRIKNFFVIAAFSIVLYSAQNLFTWLLILVIMDIIDLFHLFFQIRSIEQVKKSYASILVRFAGTLIFMAGWLLSINTTAATVISKEVLYGAILLRLFSGMLRIHTGANLIERSLGDFEEVPIFLSMHFLFFMRFPMGAPFPIWIKNLIIVGIVVMAYHLIQWLRITSRVNSMKHFLYFMIIFILLYSQFGTASGNIVLLFIFLLSMAMLYMRPIVNQYDVWFSLPLFGLVLSLPFLPTATIWNLQDTEYTTLFIPFAIYLIGFHFRFRQQKPLRKTYDRWMLVLYPAGYVPMLAGIIYLVIMHDVPIQSGNILLSIMVVVLIFLLLIYQILKKRNVISENEAFQWVAPLIDAIMKRISIVFQLDWVIRLLNGLSNIFQRMISFFNEILEGDGGLLWSIVLLILFVSIVRSLEG